jgi:hypothetical protein
MKLSLRNLFWLVLAAGLALAIGWVAIDAAQRLETLEVAFEGHGEPVKSPPAAFAAAERNVWYLLGLIVGTATGLSLAVVLQLSWSAMKAIKARRALGA